MLHTNSEADLLLLVGQSIEIVEVELSALIGQQLPLQAKQHAEVAFTAHHPDGVAGSLQVSSYLRRRRPIVFSGDSPVFDHISHTESLSVAICVLKAAQALLLCTSAKPNLTIYSRRPDVKTCLAFKTSMKRTTTESL